MNQNEDEMTEETTEIETPENAEGTPVPTPSSGTGYPADEEASNDALDEPETFPAEYVEKLRKESAGYRVKAKDRDTIAQRLHTALVAATGALADPADLPYDEDHLDDPDALQAAVDALVASKPHMAARKPRGNVGQGVTGGAATVDLAGLLRARA